MLTSIITSVGCKWIEQFLEMLMGSVEGSLWLKHVCKSDAVGYATELSRVELHENVQRHDVVITDGSSLISIWTLQLRRNMYQKRSSAFRATASDLVAVSVNSRTIYVILKCIKNNILDSIYSMSTVFFYRVLLDVITKVQKPMSTKLNVFNKWQANHVSFFK